MADKSTIEQLVDSVLSSAKYRQIAPDLVRRIGEQELAKRATFKSATKATKNKLHQITGAYWQTKPAYGDWLEQLRSTSHDPVRLRATCRTLMAQHSSTRERLPLLGRFYSVLFAGLPRIYSILDLACGLNPLTIPWMGLDGDIHYTACDVGIDQVAFLAQALPLFGVTGSSYVCDLSQGIPTKSVDVAFLFKTIPCLEQIDKQIGARLLHTLQVQVLFISFPAQSLGGRNKNMINTYTARFTELIDASLWEVKHFPFATEIVFRLTKRITQAQPAPLDRNTPQVDNEPTTGTHCER